MKITKSHLRKIIQEELQEMIDIGAAMSPAGPATEDAMAEKVEAGGGYTNKKMVQKLSQIQAKLNPYMKKMMQGEKFSPKEEAEVEKLGAMHSLVLKKMFQGTAGAEETGAVTGKRKIPLPKQESIT